MDGLQIEAIVYEYLQENPYTHYSNIVEKVLEVHKQMTGEEVLSNEDALSINELVWDLIADRVLTPGASVENPEWPWIHVSNMNKLTGRMNDDLG